MIGQTILAPPERHPVRAILVAAATGFATLAALMTWNVLTWDQDQPIWPWGGAFLVALMTGYSLLPLAVTAILTTPIWAWLSARERGFWWEAALIGFVPNFAVVFAFFNHYVGFRPEFLVAPAGWGLIGALCWLAGWWAGRERPR